jgi:hypothetical protein
VILHFPGRAGGNRDVMIIVGFSFREMICELIIDFLAIQRPLSVFEFRIGCCCGRVGGLEGLLSIYADRL